MTQSNLSDDEKLLAALALTLVNKPRANLQELASAVGISKATLYRFCPTRVELIERLIEHSHRIILEKIHNAQQLSDSPIDLLQQLIRDIMQNKEFIYFLTYYCKEESQLSPQPMTLLNNALDALFLTGQQQGFFRIDISAAVLTDLFISVVLGLVDGLLKGRIARVGLEGIIESTFLYGSRQPSAGTSLAKQ